MPAFSIVIPCYNCADTIEETLASIQAQSLSDWEVICIDDGSSDRTVAVLEQLAKQDVRLRVIRQVNAGPSRARNVGVLAAKADVVAFLDADDLWLPNKLASVEQVFQENPNADAVFGRIAFFKDTLVKDATTSTVRPGRADLSDFLGENPACTLSNLSVKRAAFAASGGFDETMRFSEDLEWCVRGITQGLSVYATDDLHVRYRASENGLSADLQAMHTGWQRAVSAARRALSERDMAAAEATHLRYLARRALRMRTSSKVGLSLALKGMRLAPTAFLGGGHRGPLTLLGCLTAPILPAPLRHRLFA